MRYSLTDDDEGEYDNDLDSYDRPVDITPLMLLEVRADHDKIAEEFVKKRKRLGKLIDEDKIGKVASGQWSVE